MNRGRNRDCVTGALSPSYTVTIQAPIHHDSSRFETDGKIGVHRDASGWKKRNSSINTMSHDAPTVSARFIYGPTMTHDGSATIHHGGFCFFVFVALRPMSTAMVIAGRSVHLTTLFPGQA